MDIEYRLILIKTTREDVLMKTLRPTLRQRQREASRFETHSVIWLAAQPLGLLEEKWK